MVNSSTFTKAAFYLEGRKNVAWDEVKDADLLKLRDQLGRSRSHHLNLAMIYDALAQLQAGHLKCADDPHSLPNQINQCEETARETLFVPYRNPEGVKLNFYTAKMNAVDRVAYTVIEPDHVDPAKPVRVFVTGKDHIFSLYLNAEVNWALAEGQRVALVDSMGVGANCLNSDEDLRLKHLSDALEVVVDQVAQGQKVELVAHSLGAGPAVSYARKHPDGFTLLELHNPVFGWQGNHAGLKYDSGFIYNGTSDLLLGRGFEAPEEPSELYYQNHSSRDRALLDPKVSRESLPLTVFGMMRFIDDVDQNNFLELMSQDSRVMVVFSKDDQLMQLANPDEWQAYRNVYFVDADHDFWVGFEGGADKVRKMQAIRRQHFADKRPFLDLQALQTGWRSRFGAHFVFADGVSVGPGYEFRMQSPFLALDGLFLASLGGSPSQGVTSAIGGQMEVNGLLRGGQVELGVGLSEGWDLIHNRRVGLFGYLHSGFDFYRVLEASARLGVDPLSPDWSEMSDNLRFEFVFSIYP